MEEYSKGIPMDIPKEKNEQALAISEWSEGNEHLQNAITTCIKNGIETFASCKGHGMTSTPYLSVKITKENLGQIINIINNLSNKNLISISLSFDEMRQGSILSVYPNMINRNNIFDLIASSAEKSLEFEDANEVSQEMIKLHGTLRRYGEKRDRMTTIIDLYNGVLTRNFRVMHGMGSYDYLLDRELLDSDFKRIRKSKTFSLKESKINKESKLKEFNYTLTSTFQEGHCESVEDDELANEISKRTQSVNQRKKQAFNKRLQEFENTSGENTKPNDEKILQIVIEEDTK